MSLPSSSQDVTPQDDLVFASLVQDIKLGSDPNSIEAEINRFVKTLEGAKAVLQANPSESNAQASWDNVANAFQYFADTARQESSRTPIGASSAVDLIVSLETLNTDRLAHVDIQAMRAFANICVDHEENRKKLLDTRAFEIIITVLKNASHPDAVRTAGGALLNTTMGYEPAQAKVVELDAIKYLLQVLQSENIRRDEDNMTIAARVTANLCDFDQGSQVLIKADGCKVVIQLLHNIYPDLDEYLDLFDALMDILRPVMEKDSAQEYIWKENLLPVLMNVTEEIYLTDEGKTEEEKKEDDKKLRTLKTELIGCIVLVTQANNNMKPIFNNREIMERFFAWLEVEDREDLQECAGLSLGNVARSDEHCTKLVHENQILKPLIRAICKAKDLKTSYAATGVLRNLALAERNQAVMGNFGVIQACYPLFKKDNAEPIQKNVIGIIKRLCANDSHNCIRVITGHEPYETISAVHEGEASNSSSSDANNGVETPLSELVDLIHRSENAELKSEGTRTICGLIKVIWSTESMKEFDARSIQALQHSLRQPFVISAITAMVRNPKYGILQSEGLIALTLLVTSTTQGMDVVLDAVVSDEVTPTPAAQMEDSGASENVPKAPTLLESVLDLVRNKDGKAADEFRTNACVFLRSALEMSARDGTDPSYLAFLKQSGIKKTMEETKDNAATRPLVKTATQQVLLLLQ